jgi:hypothetical protein
LRYEESATKKGEKFCLLPLCVSSRQDISLKNAGGVFLSEGEKNAGNPKIPVAQLDKQVSAKSFAG